MVFVTDSPGSWSTLCFIAPDKQCTLTASHILPPSATKNNPPPSHILSLLCLLLLFSLRAARSSTFPGRLQIRAESKQTRPAVGRPHLHSVPWLHCDMLDGLFWDFQGSHSCQAGAGQKQLLRQAGKGTTVH